MRNQHFELLLTNLLVGSLHCECRTAR